MVYGLVSVVSGEDGNAFAMRLQSVSWCRSSEESVGRKAVVATYEKRDVPNSILTVKTAKIFPKRRNFRGLVTRSYKKDAH